jgi:putative transcriptional regulator
MRMKETSPTLPLTGKLLVAVPALSDPHFRRTLVYVQAHDTDGSLGLILNRPVGKRLVDILGESELPGMLRETPLCFGGPVQPEHVLIALFQLDPQSGKLTCTLNPGAALIRDTRGNPHAWLRAFIGHSGWSGGQLEQELKQEDWRIDQPDPAIFNPHYCTRLWPLYATGETRWHSLVPRLPRNPERN